MAIKDVIVDWYLRNIIVPKYVNYEIPGFVIKEQQSKYGHTFQRDVFLSENLIEDLENQFIKKYGENGKKFLYGVGKNFGWNYGKSFNAPNIQNNKNEEVIKTATFLSQFIGATWAEKTNIVKLEVDSKFFQIESKDYVVCSNNGLGQLLNEGGITGLWAWLMADYSIEGIQINCQGRGDLKCSTVCAPISYFNKNNIKLNIFREKIETDFTSKLYLEFNRVRTLTYSSANLKNMISNNLVNYSEGKIEYKGERYFPLEINFLFLLEKQVIMLSGGNNLLFDIAFENGKRVALKEKNLNISFMCDFMAIMGWGDLLITPNLNKIGINYYPWSDLFDECGKEIFLGILSGFISVYKNKQIKLRIINSDNSNGYITLILGIKN